MRLHSRIYLHFLGVLLVVGLATSAVFALGARSALLREMTERLARHVGSLAGEAIHDPPVLTRRLSQLHDDFEVDLTVRDRAGRVVAVAGPESPPLSGGETAEVWGGAVVVSGRRGWHAAAPIRDPASGAVVGTLQASARRHFHPPGGWLRPALGVALVLVLVALATRPLAGRISRPLERLTQAARRLGGGELSARVDEAPPRRRRWRGHAEEIGELTRAFNEMAERIERMVRGQKELLANISHELRSPLARIRMALELLPRSGDSETRLRDVESDLTELDDLIEDVLTTARLEATGLPTRLGPVDVRQLLAQVAARAQHDPLTTGRTVRVADGPALALVADEALLKRALWNLVENAAKYGAPPITLEATTSEASIVLSVADDGEGIAPDLRTRVFEPFYRADVARTPRAVGAMPRGVGLGLTLARRIAEVHGGTIAIGPAATTADGRERGCRVTITLPRESGG